MTPETGFAVVVVNHETREHLRACLETVRAEGPGEVVVVDNASRDGSAAMVRAAFPEARLLENADNPRLRRGLQPGDRRLPGAVHPAAQQPTRRRGPAPSPPSAGSSGATPARPSSAPCCSTRTVRASPPASPS